MIRKFASTFGLLLLSCSALAMSEVPTDLHTQILFTNSTPDTLQVKINGNADVKQNTTEVLPLSTVTLAELTRHANTDSQLTIQLSTADYQLKLTQKAENNQFSFGANAADLAIAPQQDTDIQRHTATLADAPYTLAFNADDLNKGGKVTYVLQKEDVKPALGGANQLNVLSYNIWASTEYNAQMISERLAEMSAVMSGYDILVLTEVLDREIDKKLFNDLQAEYPHRTQDIFQVGKLIRSGIRVLSRWPVEHKEYLKYQACDGAQCIITRGVTYLKINKQGKPYHIFATHPQAFDDEISRQGRLKQLEEMSDFIKGMNIPANEPVIMAGDFNINKIGLPADRDYMEQVLAATEPENRGHTLSYDSNTNFWSGKPYLEYLDYTLFGKNYLHPTSAYQEVFAPRTTTDALWGKWDLSDHYAVRGIFTFPK